MTDQLFEGLEASWESPADVLKGDDLYQYHIEIARDMFGHDADLAFEKYQTDHNWSVMAEALWKLYSNYIGLGSHKQKDGDPSRSSHVEWLNKNMKKQANSLLSFFFDSSFRILDDLPREKACNELKGLRRRVEGDRAVEAATSQGTSEAIQMYDFFLVKINSELSFQQDRTDEAPILDIPEAQPVIVDEKILKAQYRESLQQQTTLNVEEAAVYVDRAIGTIYKLTSSGGIPCYKPRGKKLSFDRLELDEWLKGGKKPTTEEIDSQASTYVAVKGDNNVKKGQRSSSVMSRLN